MQYRNFKSPFSFASKFLPMEKNNSSKLFIRDSNLFKRPDSNPFFEALTPLTFTGLTFVRKAISGAALVVHMTLLYLLELRLE